ncbi:MAG: heavy metal translocating P-type ATPase [Treponema sp.]|jgi:Cu2+-exporting ATPase|nr:heavy metal translocating P-type ATPase [Treponema sp.]
MRIAVVHRLSGRVRFRTNPDTLKYYSIPLIGRELLALDGVKSAVINPRTGSILILYRREAVTADRLLALLQSLHPAPRYSGGNGVPGTRRSVDESPRPGKKIAALDRPGSPDRSSSLVWSYIGYQLVRLFRPPFLKPLFTVLGAIPYFLAGFKSIFRLRMDVPLLDASAVAVSLLRGNTNSASTLLMLLKTGQYLEEWAKERSRENLAAELSLKAGTVWVRRDNTEIEVPYSEIASGDLVVLRAGMVIPVDGKAVEGIAMVNEAALTGEPLGVEKWSGSVLYAGTIIEEGEIIVEVNKKGAETRYEQILSLIMESEKTKAETAIKAFRIADKAVPFSFAASLLTWLVTRNAAKAASILSIDYSCAIKLSVPLAFLSAIREGLSKGVFFKGSNPIEALSEVDTLVFDKTGTLTQAAPAVEKIIPYHGCGENEALKIAACLEEHFPHPAAKAVVAEALARNVQHREEHSTVKYVAAHGIATLYQEKHTVIGSRHFIGEDEGIDLSVAAEDEKKAAKQGLSILYLAQENKLKAILLIRDPLREEAKEVIVMVRRLGIKRIYLFSGDNNRAVDRIVRELSLDGGRGELLPEDKARLVRELKSRGCKVAFVGDGMNDSPAMSAADVGISMRDGSDMAREVASISLKEPSLYPLVLARIMSERVMKRIRNNIHAAVALNSIFILLGLFETGTNTGLQPNGSARSVWLHNMTTIILSLNSMRPFISE